MIDFVRITEALRATVERLGREDPQEASDYAFSYHFPFADHPRTLARFAEVAGCGVYRWEEDGAYRFFHPFGGGDKRLALKKICDFCRVRGLPVKISSMTARQAADLADQLPGEWKIAPNRDEADYVYRTEDLVNLKGRRYNSRRTFVNAFTRDGDWNYEPISEKNLEDCRQVLEEWKAHKHEHDLPFPASMAEEYEATHIVLDQFTNHDLFGGLLRKSGRPVAFEIGEQLSPSMTLLAYEKAVPTVHGAFQTGDREFARLCRTEFINRSWDEGMPGLRAMKLLYHPVRMIEKHVATMK